ncbi:MAG: TfoX/Sxy family protein [Prolixibacteraceae bacterium]|jgi:TfoX/Sxy family transcriptional regulator of competence genes
MAYNISLADRIREFFSTKPNIKVKEKKMFRGLTFMVNGKMCVNVSADNLMCRFDPSLQNEAAGKKRLSSYGNERKRISRLLLCE